MVLLSLVQPMLCSSASAHRTSGSLALAASTLGTVALFGAVYAARHGGQKRTKDRERLFQPIVGSQEPRVAPLRVSRVDSPTGQDELQPWEDPNWREPTSFGTGEEDAQVARPLPSVLCKGKGVWAWTMKENACFSFFGKRPLRWSATVAGQTLAITLWCTFELQGHSGEEALEI